MTVGIGVFCDARYSEPCIIMAVDDRATYGSPPLATHDACGKFVDMLPVAPVVVAVSGGLSVCDAVVSEFYEQLKVLGDAQSKKGKTLQLDHLRVGIREARRYEYMKYLREEMIGRLGMTLEEWQGETNPEKRRKGWGVARRAMQRFPVWLVAGGLLGRSFGLLASEGACITQMGARHFAVGCGDTTAIEWLNFRKQEPYMSAPRTLLHVAEAMEAARNAFPDYIGRPADYMILRPSNPIMRFRASSPLLGKWKTKFHRKSTASMQTNSVFRKQFEAELCPHQPTNRP